MEEREREEEEKGKDKMEMAGLGFMEVGSDAGEWGCVKLTPDAPVLLPEATRGTTHEPD